MSKLDSIFAAGVAKEPHPLLRYLDSLPSETTITIEIVRPEVFLGRKPAKLYVHVAIDGAPQPPAEYAWDDELNSALVERGVRAGNEENEKLRFSLMLRDRLRKAEIPPGEGFFNAVLVKVVRDESLLEFGEVAEVMKDVSVHEPFMEGRAYGDCKAAIKQVLVTCAKALTEDLKYDRDRAEEIFAGAVAHYLDDRFNVSARRNLGWA